MSLQWNNSNSCFFIVSSFLILLIVYILFHRLPLVLEYVSFAYLKTMRCCFSILIALMDPKQRQGCSRTFNHIFMCPKILTFHCNHNKVTNGGLHHFDWGILKSFKSALTVEWWRGSLSHSHCIETIISWSHIYYSFQDRQAQILPWALLTFTYPKIWEQRNILAGYKLYVVHP